MALLLFPALAFTGPLEDLLPRPKEIAPAEGTWRYDEARITSPKVSAEALSLIHI